VIDERGQPLAKKEVEWGYAGSHSTRTDKSGAFELRPGHLLLRPHSWLRVCDDAGRATCWDFDERWDARDRSRPLHVVLPSAASSIRGAVVDARGIPAAGWYVTTKPVERGAANVVLTRDDLASERTDAAGSFRVQYLAPGPHDLIAVSPDGWAAFTLDGIETGRTDVTMRVPTDLVMPLLRGRVETSEGAPLAGVEVGFHQPISGGCVRYVKTERTDAEGRFEIAGLSRRLSNIRIDVVPPEFTRMDEMPLLIDELDRTVVRLPVRRRVVFERRRLDIEGDRVSFIDARGKPLPSWRCPGPGIDETLLDWTFPYVILDGDLSPELLVDPNAAFAVVSSARAEIARVPLHLQPDVTNRVVWVE
jgi:hypothetical protein